MNTVEIHMVRVSLAVVFVLSVLSAQTQLTVYNQNFAVVRENIHLDLQKGVNQITFTDTTAHLEPDSVMLRDPAG